MTKPFLTIFTPLYNRRKFLPRLFESLLGQTDTDFEWIVIDDGSTDCPNEFFESLNMKEIPFEITFLSVKNGGKHRAVNKGVGMAKGEWFLILDSDDWLTSDAISIIKNRVAQVDDNKLISCICGLRVTPDNKDIGSVCNYSILDCTFFDYRYKYRIKGDRAEVVRTSVMRECPFPEFAEEKFLGEGIVWNEISKKYLTRFTADRFYICDYQLEGLTDTFSTQLLGNPLGAMANDKEVITYPACPLGFKLLSVLFYFKHYKIAKDKYGKSSIPQELKPTRGMHWYRLLNPVTTLFLGGYRWLRRYRRGLEKVIVS